MVNEIQTEKNKDNSLTSYLNLPTKLNFQHVHVYVVIVLYQVAEGYVNINY
jgi:hypothetical protein